MTSFASKLVQIILGLKELELFVKRSSLKDSLNYGIAINLESLLFPSLFLISNDKNYAKLECYVSCVGIKLGRLPLGVT